MVGSESPVTHLLACLGLNVNVSVRSMTARRNRWRFNGLSRTTTTPPTTIYLDREINPRGLTLLTAFCANATNKEAIFHPRSRGYKRRASGSNRSIAIDNRKVSENVSIYHESSRVDVGKRLSRPSRLNVLTSSPSRLDLVYLHNFTITLASGPDSTCHWEVKS